MDNIKNDAYYVGKILKDVKFIISHTQNLTPQELENNEILCDSILFRLIQISENSLKLSSDFKEEHKEISWQAIKGMRNRIVHEYGNVNLNIVYLTVTQNIPDLCRRLENIQ